MTRDDPNAVNEMVSEFIAEIKDDLAGLEPDLLAMEEASGRVDDGLVNHAFRTIHSIKGGAGFISFTELSDLGHAMENVLMQIREKTREITPEIVDALLFGFDKMRHMVDNMGSRETVDISPELKALEDALSGRPGASGAPGRERGKESGKKPETNEPDMSGTGDDAAIASDAADAEPETAVASPGGPGLSSAEPNPLFDGKTFPVDEQRLEEALARQQFIYAVFLENPGADLADEMAQIGHILFPESPDREPASPWTGVVATILDKKLLAEVLETPPQNIVFLERQFVPLDTLLATAVPPATRKADEPDRPVPDQTAPDQNTPDQNTPDRTGSEQHDERPAPPEISASGADRQTSRQAVDAVPADQTIRINVSLISRLMNRAGELVLCRNQLRPFMENLDSETGEAAFGMQALEMVTADIQDAVMQMRMKPVSDLLGKYKRVIRDMARRMNKKVDFILEGGAVEVDRNILEQLANPMTHLIRNCIDHGIEPPEERLKNGKPETGTLAVQVFHQGGNVHIDIRDDGAGMDPDRILAKAMEKGLAKGIDPERLSDREKTNLIFLPGFSTSDTITDISGRGVGMDVVKTNLERLRGHITIDSQKGRGTVVHLIIPLTLAIVPSLIVGEGAQLFAIPQVNIKEIIFLSPGEIADRVEHIAGNEVLRLRENLLPVLRLRTCLDIKTFVRVAEDGGVVEERRRRIADRRKEEAAAPAETPGGNEKRYNGPDRRQKKWDAVYVIVLKLGTHLFGLLTEKLYDIEEVVVEPLSGFLQDLKWFAGATILGDGRVIMVLDVPGIAAASALTFDSVKDEEARRNLDRADTAKEGRHKNLMVFENSPGEFFAMDLESVSRLEPLTPEDLYHTGTLTYTEFNRQAALVFSMDAFLPASPCPTDAGPFYLIYLKNMDAPVGIAAASIVDTIQTRETIRTDTGSPDSVLGKLFMDGMMIQVLDPSTFRSRVNTEVARVKGGAALPV